MKKVLVLCENIYYDNTSAGIVNTNIIHALTQQYEVHCLYNERYDAELPDFYGNSRNLKTSTVNFSTTKGFYTFLNKIPKLRAIPAFLSGINSLEHNKINNWHFFANEKIKENEYSLIVALGTGHEFLAHFAVDKLETNIPKLLQIHDPFPLNVYPDPFKQEKTGIYKNLQRSFNKILKRTDFVGFPSLELKKWMQKFYDFRDEQFVLLPHPQSFVKLPESPDYSFFKSENHFNLVHVGFLWSQRDPSVLLSAFQKFCKVNAERQERAQLYFFGATAENHLANFSKQKNENVNFVNGRIKYEESINILCAATANILIEAVAEISPIMPGKLADYINVDNPIIALTPTHSEVSRLLGDDYKYKSTVNDEGRIIEILEQLWENWKESQVLKLNRKDLSYHISSNHIIQVVDQMITKHK